MTLDQFDQYVTIASSVVAGAIALGHGLEAVVKFTATKADDEALAKALDVLNKIAAFLPRLRVGKPLPQPIVDVVKASVAPAAPTNDTK